MNGEFNGYCCRYYNLKQLLDEQNEYLIDLLNNSPLYAGQTSINEIDDILKYYRKVQRVKARLDDTVDAMQNTERTILMIMQHFEIPPGTVLNGEVPEEVEFEIWADDTDAIHVRKTKDLAPPVDDKNIIRIKVCNSRRAVMDDDD
jgi:hypothetical protein